MRAPENLACPAVLGLSALIASAPIYTLASMAYCGAYSLEVGTLVVGLNRACVQGHLEMACCVAGNGRVVVRHGELKVYMRQ